MKKFLVLLTAVLILTSFYIAPQRDSFADSRNIKVVDLSLSGGDSINAKNPPNCCNVTWTFYPTTMSTPTETIDEGQFKYQYWTFKNNETSTTCYVNFQDSNTYTNPNSFRIHFRSDPACNNTFSQFYPSTMHIPIPPGQTKCVQVRFTAKDATGSPLKYKFKWSFTISKDTSSGQVCQTPPPYSWEILKNTTCCRIDPPSQTILTPMTIPYPKPPECLKGGDMGWFTFKFKNPCITESITYTAVGNPSYPNIVSNKIGLYTTIPATPPPDTATYPSSLTVPPGGIFYVYLKAQMPQTANPCNNYTFRFGIKLGCTSASQYVYEFKVPVCNTCCNDTNVILAQVNPPPTPTPNITRPAATAPPVCKEFKYSIKHNCNPANCPIGPMYYYVVTPLPPGITVSILSSPSYIIGTAKDIILKVCVAGNCPVGRKIFKLKVSWRCNGVEKSKIIETLINIQ